MPTLLADYRFLRNIVGTRTSPMNVRLDGSSREDPFWNIRLHWLGTWERDLLPSSSLPAVRIPSDCERK
jgi:hypothetical protein